MQKKKANASKAERDFTFPKWQKGDYDRAAPLHYPYPQGFLGICKLTEVTPAKVINDFAKNFGSGGEKDKDQKQAKQKLLEYFIAMGYGQQMYATADIALMFKELEAVHLLWPETAKPKFREKHVKWREKYERYWFKHWYKKPRKRIKTPYYQ